MAEGCQTPLMPRRGREGGRTAPAQAPSKESERERERASGAPRQGFWCQKPSGAGGLEGTARASDHSDSVVGGVSLQVLSAKVLELHMRSNRKRKARPFFSSSPDRRAL